VISSKSRCSNFFIGSGFSALKEMTRGTGKKYGPEGNSVKIPRRRYDWGGTCIGGRKN